jgi:glyoxylase-like metal-dependent hydrolase (beta-lactamase superfamily II)
MEITSKIHLLKIDFSVQITPEKSLPRFVNSIIIFGDTITIIDSGVKDSYIHIYDYIEKNNRKVSEIKTLIISHSHPDHIGSANRIKNDTGCKVIGHVNEKDWIENIDMQYHIRPVPGFYNLVEEPVTLDLALIGGEELSLSKDITVRVINTPGHSKGSFSMLFKEDMILFTADSLPLENDIPTYDNFKELKNSVATIKSLHNYKSLLSSWTAPIYDKNEIQLLIENGDKYLDKLDLVVKEYYLQNESAPLENCRKVITTLGLPPLFVIPLVDRAFRTH